MYCRLSFFFPPLHSLPLKIWPMSLIMRALTSNNSTEISECLETIKVSALQGSTLKPGQGYGFMHESFWQNNPASFTRPWFSWANSLFGELMIKLVQQGHPCCQR
eukprot:TRINITY_DN1586_c0_g1_i10.p1 TRINITY_DN1586_c0_g1~~TRINITY_DN1586_c0_g1_i10.p1  ORF type:complete len:105 (-),score=11.45 TRINITY_DN1586_c0_g1_i10:87-401(-)